MKKYIYNYRMDRAVLNKKFVNLRLILVTIFITTTIITGVIYLWNKNYFKLSIYKLSLEVNVLNSENKRLKLENEQLKKDEGFLKKDLEVMDTDLKKYVELSSKPFPELIEMVSFIKNRFFYWVYIWESKITGFDLKYFKYKEKSVISLKQHSTINYMRMPLWVYSPDKSKCLDPYVSLNIWKKDGKIYGRLNLDAGGIRIIDFKKNVTLNLLNFGFSYNINDALWIDNNAFVLLGSARSGKNYVFAFIDVYKLSGNYAVVAHYEGPGIKEDVFNNEINVYLLDYFKKRIFKYGIYIN